MGARCLLVDEDTAATNFMIRDARMEVGAGAGVTEEAGMRSAMLEYMQYDSFLTLAEPGSGGAAGATATAHHHPASAAGAGVRRSGANHAVDLQAARPGGGPRRVVHLGHRRQRAVFRRRR